MMRTLVTMLVASSGCAPRVEAIRRAGIDPCVLGELAAIDAAIVDEFGSWTWPPSRAVWCDLPGVQADPDGRALFAPLWTAEEMVFELCPADGDACEPLGLWAGLHVTPWTWECASGASVDVGSRVEWTCEGLGLDVEGSPEWYVAGRGVGPPPW